jgi:hypothetical protein
MYVEKIKVTDLGHMTGSTVIRTVRIVLYFTHENVSWRELLPTKHTFASPLLTLLFPFGGRRTDSSKPRSDTTHRASLLGCQHYKYLHTNSR